MSLEQWIDEERTRRAADQHSRADSLKLVATFMSAVAVTLTATALQTGRPSLLDRLSLAATGLALALALAVILEDRLKDPDVTRTLLRAEGLSRTNAQKLDDLRLAASTVVIFNEEELARLQRRLRPQVLTSVLASALAAWSLLAGA